MLEQRKANNSTTECVAWKNEQLVYCGCTGEFAALLGFESVSDVIGKTDHDLMPGIDVSRNTKLDREVISSSIEITSRGYLSSVDGEEIDALVRISAISTDNEKGVKLAITVVDYVVDTDSDEPDINAYKKVLDQLETGVFICEDAKAVYVNRKCSVMLGYRIDEMLAMDDIYELIAPADRARIEKHSLQLHRHQSYEVTAIHENGDELLLEINATLILWNGRAATQVSLVDISQLVIVEAALSQATEVLQNERTRLEAESNHIFSGLAFPVSPNIASIEKSREAISTIKMVDSDNNKFREIAEDAPFGLMILDDFKPLFANKKTVLFFGYQNAAELLKNKSIEAHIVADDLARLWNYQANRLSGRPVPVEYDFEVINSQSKEIIKLHCIESSISWNGKEALHLALFDVNRFSNEVEQLKYTESRYKHFVEIAADFVLELDELFNISQLSSPLNVAKFQTRKNLSGQSFYDDFSQRGADQGQLLELLRMIQNHKSFRDYQLKIIHKNDDYDMISISGSPHVHASGRFLGYRMVGKDVTAEHKRYQKLHFEAQHDALTNLVNRREFERNVSKALDAVRGRKVTHALCYLDLDRFKVVNDQCGHLAGDELLRKLSQKMSDQLRNTDTLARLGGDEFGVFLNHCTIDEALKVANQLCATVAGFQFLWKENSFNVGVSVGMVSISSQSGDLDKVLLLADQACYKAKTNGRGHVVVSPDEVQNVLDQTGENYWTDAFESGDIERRFKLMKQDIIPVAALPSEGHCYELLLRVVNENGKLMRPGQVLAVADRLNMLIKIDRWVFDKVITFLSQQNINEEISLCTINLSSPSVLDVDYLNYLLLTIDQSGISPSLLGFEISESTAVMNITRTSYFIERVKSLGCSIVLDNFGSGLSSFSYLSQFEADFLKIDGALVNKILDDPVSLALLQSINDVAHAMGMKTIASNVENASVLNRLKTLGIDYAQGHHISQLSIIIH